MGAKYNNVSIWVVERLILEKKFNVKKYDEMLKLYENKSMTINIRHDIITIETNDTEIINYAESNFENLEDIETTKLRLDAIEALVVGEQSTLSKIRSRLGL